MLRAVRFIQKTIHVTKPTATREATPAKIISARSVIAPLVKDSATANRTDSTTAPATPSHTQRRCSRRSVLTR